ncbi:hypothetical protein PHISP_00331 [Aspergillus sp. HF37]|nr:hypothetical protein PHISP_00331 [Aspergillus sp. HF37]
MSTPIVQNILALPARFRQQLGTVRSRFATESTPKSKGHILQSSLRVHRPVWVTAGTATYTSAAAVYLVMRCMRHLR